MPSRTFLPFCQGKKSSFLNLSTRTRDVNDFPFPPHAFSDLFERDLKRILSVNIYYYNIKSDVKRKKFYLLSRSKSKANLSVFPFKCVTRNENFYFLVFQCLLIKENKVKFVYLVTKILTFAKVKVAVGVNKIQVKSRSSGIRVLSTMD